MYSGRRKFPQTPNVNDSSHLEIHQTTITKRGRKRKTGRRKCKRRKKTFQLEKKKENGGSVPILSNEVKPYTVQKILLLLSHLWGGEKRKNTSSLFSLSVHYIDAGTSEHNRVYSSMLLRVQTVREKHISNERERERREHPSSSGIQKRDDEGRRKK
jgi:hypothetical protein